MGIMLDVCAGDDYNGHMKIAGVAELKARLSSFLEEVRAGNEIVVTDRGVPIARLVPMEGKPEGGERRKRLIRAGLLRPGRGRLKELHQRPEGERVGGEVLRALLAEREAGR
jgi:prevent-host-death family protein